MSFPLPFPQHSSADSHFGFFEEITSSCLARRVLQLQFLGFFPPVEGVGFDPQTMVSFHMAISPFFLYVSFAEHLFRLRPSQRASLLFSALAPVVPSRREICRRRRHFFSFRVSPTAMFPMETSSELFAFPLFKWPFDSSLCAVRGSSFFFWSLIKWPFFLFQLLGAITYFGPLVFAGPAVGGSSFGHFFFLCLLSPAFDSVVQLLADEPARRSEPLFVGPFFIPASAT